MKYLALLVFLVACSKSDVGLGPKFQVGDCIDMVDNSLYEFTERVGIHPRKILKVGNFNYLYQFATIEAESSIRSIDLYNEKVDCKSVGF